MLGDRREGVVGGWGTYLSRMSFSRGGPVGSRGWGGDASRWDGDDGCACVSVPFAIGPFTSGGRGEREVGGLLGGRGGCRGRKRKPQSKFHITGSDLAGLQQCLPPAAQNGGHFAHGFPTSQLWTKQDNTVTQEKVQ